MPYYEGKFDFSDVIDMQKDIANLPMHFEDSMLKTSVEVETAYLPRLQEYPPRRAVHPFPFETPRSRRKYFWLISQGLVRTDGYGYVRNGAYGRAWHVDIEQTGDEYRIRVYNTMPAANYVGGIRQVTGHANTGWIRFNPILDEIGEFADRAFFDTVKPYV